MIYIGDTPEQLGSCNVADAVIIGGKVYTKDLIAELEREKAELMAQVELLKRAIESISKDCQECIFDDETGLFIGLDVLCDAEDLAEQTPNQCLNQIKAEAVIEAINAHKNNVLTFDFDTAIRVTDLIQYANKLRGDL